MEERRRSILENIQPEKVVLSGVSVEVLIASNTSQSISEAHGEGELRQNLFCRFPLFDPELFAAFVLFQL